MKLQKERFGSGSVDKAALHRAEALKLKGNVHVAKREFALARVRRGRGE